MSHSATFAMLVFIGACVVARAETIAVRVTWGHNGRPPQAQPVTVKAGGGMRIEELAKTGQLDGGADGLQFVLNAPGPPAARLQNLQIIWADLIAAADADTARRLGGDAAMVPNSPRLYIQMGDDGTHGFALTFDQLKQHRAFWVPALDIYIAAGQPFTPFAEHRKSLEPLQGKRMLEQVERDAEATYDDYAARWEDMGDPAYSNPQQRGLGHIVGLAWDSSIHKFGIDRGGGVQNDLGNPDRFRFWFDFGDITKGIVQTWKGQSLHDGLPLLTTIFEREQLRYELEQFAYPLNGPPPERRGDMRMVLMQRLRVSSLDGQARHVPVTMSLRRALNPGLSAEFLLERNGRTTTVNNGSFGQTLLEVDGGDSNAAWAGVHDYDDAHMKRMNITIELDVPAHGAREVVVKLPSPMLSGADAATLEKLDYESARTQTIQFWNAWLERGAEFQVPEKVVNDLFRANLWHALRLPRRHGAAGDVRIDLPYSNFAYGQTGTPWPVNQAVYVDYMLFGLRGYRDVATEELLAQYRNNQEINGHISGYANWVVYTPGMLYAVAQDFLLTGDRAAFDRLLEPSMKAVDWCLSQLDAAERREGPAKGLVLGPLNDLTGEGVWAFNQAYMYAGLDLFGQALEKAGNPRGADARAAAKRLALAIDRGFRTASARSPLVELRDHTWIPYVPCEADRFHRILDDWYPADVDTGPVHLLRLKAVAPKSDLADWLLNDHEDNLFYRGWGIANEPVYNQHATAYLLRDDVKAVIRTFYSYMTSAFSHTALEPVEHRFSHGQYFGPPSTDGAWFELYRHMLIHEEDDDTLLLAGFTPRAWLDDGKQIVVRRAPTRFGLLSMKLSSSASAGHLAAELTMPDRSKPAALLVRFRHPNGKRIQKVTVNGKEWPDYDVAKEWVTVKAPEQSNYSIVAYY